jgi:hypothetical protein
MAFIDLRKAYGSVPLNKLWQVMEEQGVKQYIWAVKNLYTDMTSSIKVGQHDFQEFHITKGLGQDCCRALTLFKMVPYRT